MGRTRLVTRHRGAPGTTACPCGKRPRLTCRSQCGLSTSTALARTTKQVRRSCVAACWLLHALTLTRTALPIVTVTVETNKVKNVFKALSGFGAWSKMSTSRAADNSEDPIMQSMQSMQSEVGGSMTHFSEVQQDGSSQAFSGHQEAFASGSGYASGGRSMPSTFSQTGRQDIGYGNSSLRFTRPGYQRTPGVDFPPPVARSRQLAEAKLNRRAFTPEVKPFGRTRTVSAYTDQFGRSQTPSKSFINTMTKSLPTLRPLTTGSQSTRGRGRTGGTTHKALEPEQRKQKEEFERTLREVSDLGCY